MDSTFLVHCKVILFFPFPFSENDILQYEVNTFTLDKNF
jgi:hypothetical protein